jgi:hypothetical protein
MTSKIKRTFITKSILALRDLLQSKEVKVKNKYFCLQIINICMLMENEIFVEFFSKKLLDNLYSLACYNKNSENETENGKNLFNDCDDKNEEFSVKFYFLLLEMFGYWGKTNFFKNNQKIFSKYKVLLNSTIHFPRENEYIFEYCHYFKKHLPNVNKNSNQEDKEELEDLLKGVSEALELIKDYFENNNKPDDYFDELIQNYLKGFKDLNELRENMNYTQKKKFSELEDFTDIYLENKDNFSKLKKTYKNYANNKNPFLKKEEVEDQLSHQNDNNKIEDVISNESFNLKKKNKNQKNIEVQNKHKIKGDDEDLEKVIHEYLQRERNDLLKKVRDMERALNETRRDKDKLEVKFDEVNINLKKAQETIERLSEDNKNKSDQINTFNREIQKYLKTKNNISSPPPPLNYSAFQNMEKEFSTKYTRQQPKESFQRSTHNSSLLGNAMPLKQPNSYYDTKFETKFDTKFNTAEDLGVKRQNQSFNDINQFTKGKSSYYNGDLNSFKSKMADDKNFMDNINSSINKILKRDRNSMNNEKNENGRSNSMMDSKFNNIYDKKENNLYNPYSMKMSTNLRLDSNSGIQSKESNTGKFGSSMMEDYLRKYSGNRNSYSAKEQNGISNDNGNTSGGIFKYKNI